MARQKLGFVPSPMIRTKSVKILARDYEDLGEQIARLKHRQDLVKAEIQRQVGIDYETVVKLGPDDYRKVIVSKCHRNDYDNEKLRATFPHSKLETCRSKTSFIRVNVNTCSEDVYLSYF